jgi:hypothetical protein
LFLFIQHKHEFSCFSCSFVATYVIFLFMFLNSCLCFYVVHVIFLLFVFCSSYYFLGTLPFVTFNLYMCGVIRDSKLWILCSQLVLVLCLIYIYICLVLFVWLFVWIFKCLFDITYLFKFVCLFSCVCLMFVFILYIYVCFIYVCYFLKIKMCYFHIPKSKSNTNIDIESKYAPIILPCYNCHIVA